MRRHRPDPLPTLTYDEVNYLVKRLSAAAEGEVDAIGPVLRLLTTQLDSLDDHPDLFKPSASTSPTNSTAAAPAGQFRIHAYTVDYHVQRIK